VENAEGIYIASISNKGGQGSRIFLAVLQGGISGLVYKVEDAVEVS